jgi:hypothetical protein
MLVAEVSADLVTLEYEVNAFCVEGYERGEWLGGAVWGVSFLPGIMEPVYDYDEPGTLDQPTPSFLAAVEDWQFLHPSAMPPPVPTIRGGARCKD